ncbi:hypothetical protein BDZ91DRAFT_797381 [Kalaharituber pfeilii]|nr:hypothetical protein BDZ91DRAFT_797381 [Kalaharituber pfeilii]
MEVVGFAFGVVGLAGPFSKACISGYELLRGAATTAEDAADFRLRVDTEMGLLNLWIKHWVNQHNGRIRGSAQIGEQVCVLAVDILAKIGTLLLDAGKLQAKYGIQVRSGTGLLQGEIQRVGTGLGGEIKRVGTGTSMSAGSERTIVEKGSRIGLSGLEVLNEDDGQGKSKETVNQRLIMSRRSSVTLIQNGATLPSEAPVPSHSTSKKESRIRRWLRKAGFIKSKPQSAKVLMQQGTMNETAFTAIANPAQVTDKDASLQATTPGGCLRPWMSKAPLSTREPSKHRD